MFLFQDFQFFGFNQAFGQMKTAIKLFEGISKTKLVLMTNKNDRDNCNGDCRWAIYGSA